MSAGAITRAELDAAIDELYGRLAPLVRQLQGKGPRATGQFNLSFVASSIAQAGAIPHGLNRIPDHISVTPTNVPGFTQIPALDVHNVTATTFDVSAIAPAASSVVLVCTFSAE